MRTWGFYFFLFLNLSLSSFTCFSLSSLFFRAYFFWLKGCFSLSQTLPWTWEASPDSPIAKNTKGLVLMSANPVRNAWSRSKVVALWWGWNVMRWESWGGRGFNVFNEHHVGHGSTLCFASVIGQFWQEDIWMQWLGCRTLSCPLYLSFAILLLNMWREIGQLMSLYHIRVLVAWSSDWQWEDGRRPKYSLD